MPKSSVKIVFAESLLNPTSSAFSRTVKQRSSVIDLFPLGYPQVSTKLDEVSLLQAFCHLLLVRDIDSVLHCKSVKLKKFAMYLLLHHKLDSEWKLPRHANV
jgi:hypothetical protein